METLTRQELESKLKEPNKYTPLEVEVNGQLLTMDLIHWTKMMAISTAAMAVATVLIAVTIWLKV